MLNLVGARNSSDNFRRLTKQMRSQGVQAARHLTDENPQIDTNTRPKIMFPPGIAEKRKKYLRREILKYVY